MRLLHLNNHGTPCLEDFSVDNIAHPYAILSHTWRQDGGEVTYKDVLEGTAKSKAGYEKIQFCGDKTVSHGLKSFWVDTCCIDKSSSTELQEAINSMFRWYRDAARCYVYLSDVSVGDSDLNSQIYQFPWESAFRASRWFTRGWTLQELLAPRLVKFFSREGERLGDKRSLERQIHEATRIAVPALQGSSLSQFSVDERFKWAQNRETTREEDWAYSLLGIFDIFIPLIYGEGKEKAIIRLRKEINEASKGPAGLLNYLPCAEDAPFNSFAKQHEPTCLPNTRVDLLHEIFRWAEGADERNIFWLNGLAGTGKSTIARTVARRYFEQKLLGASFFFSRGGGDVSHAHKFFTSIAVQLADRVPTLQRYIHEAVKEHQNIASLTLQDQWRRLILGPLSKIKDDSCRSSYILVLDALDECDDNNNIRIILDLLAEARSVETVRLRVFLTSRPEIPIRHGFYQISEAEHQNFVLHNISPSIVDHDISIFLRSNLKFIAQERSLGTGWPGEQIIKCLVHKASGLFIWAATASRFIREGKQFAAKRLDMILESSSTAINAPEKHLNDIYITVLRHSISPNYTDEEAEMLRYMLKSLLGSIVTLLSPLSTQSLSKLLNTSQEEVDQTLNDLHTILEIPKDPTRSLRLHHPSFRDFLLDRKRCGDSNFWVDEKQAHQSLAISCIQHMSKFLKEDMCGIARPGALVTDVESSQVEQYLPPDIQYACLYWIQHLQKSGVQLHDNDQVHQFLQEHLLHWFETLGWMGKMSEGIHEIISLEFTTAAFQCPRLSEFVHDMKRFVLYNRSAIEQAPLQTYCSALIFTPAMSVVRKQFQDCVPRWMRRLPKVENNWNALLQTLEGHSHWVSAVAFSPDGKLLASASRDKTVKLWDAGSGAVLQTLEGHSAWVRVVAFSPDGKLLASASRDKTVRLWDAGSGAMLQTLEDHSGWVNAVTFSPDGKLLASASRDMTVRLWDAGSGTVLQTLKINVYIQTLSFSDDGIFLQTDKGPLYTAFLSNGAAVSRLNLPRSVFIHEQWVNLDMKNLFWLPPEYRPDHVAVHGNIVGFGYRSGRVLIMEFAF